MSASFSQPPILSFTEMATSNSELRQAHAHLLKTGLLHDPFAASRLITSAAITTNSLSYAHRLFEEMPEPNVYTYNTMIRAFANTSNPEQALHVFLQLLDDELFPDKYTFTFSLKACSILRSVREGSQVHGLVIKSGIEQDVYICNTLIHLYANCGYFETARNLLDRMSGRDVISWNAILSAYVEMGLVELAREFFNEMPDKNLESWNFMISGLVSGGLLEEAKVVFDDMPLKDVVSWNAMITGYARMGRFAEVLLVFKDMQNAKVKPDNYTLVSLLSACSHLGSLSEGEWIYAYTKKNRIEVSGFLATALVDMYSKCGCIEKALEVFHNTSEKDISTWNSMITGLSIHGFGERALMIFNELLVAGFTPNEATFVSVLSACSRAGLLDEGLKMFDAMVSVHRLKPTIEHYGCMVDLLGRFGMLEEAEEIANKILPEEAPVVLQSLLGACRNHGNVVMAERIARKLLEIDPQDSAAYIQISSIKASMERWKDVKDVRKKMKAQGVTKDPGCSMIEVDGVVHEFLAGEGIISQEGNKNFLLGDLNLL